MGLLFRVRELGSFPGLGVGVNMMQPLDLWFICVGCVDFVVGCLLWVVWVVVVVGFGVIIDMCYGVGVDGLLLGFCDLIFPWFRGFARLI